MKVAYIDTSLLVAIAFDEPGSRDIAQRLNDFDRLLSSNLLEAEFRATLLRETVEDPDPGFLTGIDWILPDRPLTKEIQQIGEAGYLRGADLWHLACAVLVSPNPSQLFFLTLDQRQAEVAKRLGFQVTD